MRTLSFPIAMMLAGTLMLGGCPKKGPTEVSLDADQENNVDYIFSKGQEAIGVGNFEQAYELFAKSADTLNGGPKAEFNAGWTAERIGRVDAAAAHYRDAYNANPDYEPARYSLLRVLKTQGKYADAAQIYGDYVAKHPDDTKARTEYMDALVSAGQYDEVVSISQDILRKDPKNDAVYRALSAMYLKKGQTEMAQIMGDKALELNDKDPDLYNNLGVVALQQGDEPGAVEKFKMARMLDSTHFEANVNLGLIAANSGDYFLALDCFNKALERNPASVDARLGKAVALRGTGDTEGSLKLYDELIKEDPKLQVAYFNAATVHEIYTKDYTKAIKYLEAYKDARAGELSPTDEVFQRIEKVLAAKAADEEAKRLAAEKKKAEEERIARMEKLLKDMTTAVAEMKAKVDANLDCLGDAGAELSMFVEFAQETISTKDTSMASDLETQLKEYYQPMLDAGLQACGGAPAPEEGAPPAEGTPPAEGAPAEPAPTEPAPAEPAPTEPAPQ